MYLTGTPSRAAIAAAISGETPVGSPEGLLPVTNRKFPMLIAARKTPVGASSVTAWSGMAEIRELSETNAASCRIAAVAARENSAGSLI